MKLLYRRVSYAGSARTRDLERALDYMLDHARNSPLAALSDEWRPPIDVYETNSHVVVLVELAGMNEDSIQIVLFEDVLMIKGERVPSFETDGDVVYHEAGVRYGRCRAVISLPASVQDTDADALYENGFLRVRLPKPGPRRVAALPSEAAHE